MIHQLIRRSISTTKALRISTSHLRLSTMAATTRPPLIFRQLFEKESSTYTYLLGCPETQEAVLVDPVDVTVERDMHVVRDLNLTLVAAINTHAHADHITGTGLIKARPEWNADTAKTMISASSGAAADATFTHGDLIKFGSRFLSVRAVPGHTAGCVAFVLDDESLVMTGDALLIRGCGRTDFQGGSAETLYKSVQEQLFTLPDTCMVYPAHDYLGRTTTSIGEEKRLNPRLTQDLEGFVATMAGLNLPYPKKIDAAVPANMRCGVPDEPPAEVAATAS